MRAILTFQGFTESARQRTGTEDLFFTVIREFSGAKISTPWPYTWKEDVDSLANMVARQGIRQVALVSYSHGQAAATDFADAAYSLGIDVDLWLACDPVYRPDWLPRWDWIQPAAFRALGRTAKIQVPHNIARVASVRQKLIVPMGHDLITDKRTEQVKPLVLPYGHTGIDSSPEWCDLVKSELATWCRDA